MSVYSRQFCVNIAIILLKNSFMLQLSLIFQPKNDKYAINFHEHLEYTSVVAGELTI